MLKFFIVAILFLYTATGLTMLQDKLNKSHLESNDDTQSFTVKFRKDDIQDPNKCRKNDEECEVKICPDTRVMKSSYSCYSVLKTELD